MNLDITSTMEFSNLPIQITDLPNFKNVELKGIDKKYKTVLWFNFLILVLFFSGLLVTAFILFEGISFFLLVLMICGLTFILLFNAVEIIKGFPKRKFGLRELDIIFQKGFFFFSETVIPFKRIQHVEIKQGPVLRILGLYSLKLYTAGASSGDLVIDGLNLFTAEKLKAKVLQVTEEEDE